MVPFSHFKVKFKGHSSKFQFVVKFLLTQVQLCCVVSTPASSLVVWFCSLRRSLFPTCRSMSANQRREKPAVFLKRLPGCISKLQQSLRWLKMTQDLKSESADQRFSSSHLTKAQQLYNFTCLKTEGTKMRVH